MARIDFGATTGETIFMLKTKTQDHEDLLMGDADSKIDGVVPRFNRMDAQHEAYRKMGVVLNALILIALMGLGLMQHFHW